MFKPDKNVGHNVNLIQDNSSNNEKWMISYELIDTSDVKLSRERQVTISTILMLSHKYDSELSVT